MARRRSAGKAAKPKVYVCAVGTRTEMVESRYAALDGAKKHAGDAFAKWTDWCQRHNAAGIKVLGDGKLTLDAIGEPEVQMGPQRIECTFDEHTGMALVVELRKERS